MKKLLRIFKSGLKLFSILCILFCIFFLITYIVSYLSILYTKTMFCVISIIFVFALGMLKEEFDK